MLIKQGMHGPTGEYWIGSAAMVSEAAAIEIAAGLRDRIAKGEDVFQEKRDRKKQTVTLGWACDEFWKVHEPTLKNDKHKSQWVHGLTVKWKALRDKPISKVTVDDVYRTIKPVWETTLETAEKNIEQLHKVFLWAIAFGYAKESPAQKAVLKNRLGTPRKKVQHLAALPWRDMPAFMPRLRCATGLGARALELVILTATRTTEARAARIEEFDLKQKIWTIPDTRMKGGKQHVVTLSDAAVTLLSSLIDDRKKGLLFPGMDGDKPISDMTMNAVLKRMKAACTVHGFRSSFRDWAGANDQPREIVEECLSHEVGNAVERAYKREALLKQRRIVLEAWSAYLAPKESNVVAIRG
ncbi:site-specific integrase [Ensifer sp. ENS02]|uniref:tyrosine-type recombinase/integrase n=1 Tax=Ensifer sp. ENS02 TaxID=2769290 RepID=UPI0017809A14|nr:site-specific integrase [Ensifer sp. ENS02]